MKTNASNKLREYYNVLRELPNKTEFDKGRVRGLYLAIQILEAGDEMSAEEAGLMTPEEIKETYGKWKQAK